MSPAGASLSFGGFLLTTLLAGAAAPASAPTPDLLGMKASWIDAAKTALAAGDPRLSPALEQLVLDAETALNAGPFTVMAKSIRPPSGDRHDYMSFGPYWWPNPETSDGLPYVRRDGDLNPEARDERSDSRNLIQLAIAVDRLALAFTFTGEARFAEAAARLIHTWFLNPETAMNPHLEYGQAIPGRVEGRGIGIIESRNFLNVIDAAILIRGSEGWTESDHQSLKEWFRAYLTWLRTSSHGIDESRTLNNHGTWYDVQVVSFALFIGDRETALRTLETVAENRFETQINLDGSQPGELARTKSFNYSTMNLMGMSSLAHLGEKLGLDLWNHRVGDTVLLRAALDFLAPHIDPENAWPHEQIGAFEPIRLLPLLRQGFLIYGDPELLRWIEQARGEAMRRDRSVLLYPVEAQTSSAGTISRR